MAGHHPSKESDDISAPHSDAMRYALRCLDGKRNWKGDVRGLFGLVNRTFTIESEGAVTPDGLIFAEVLRFDDGETQSRRWRVFDTPDGLGLDADDIGLIKHGRLSNGVLEIVYKIKLKPIGAAYLDRFRALDDGAVIYFGKVAVLGVPIMKVTAKGSAIKES